MNKYQQARDTMYSIPCAQYAFRDAALAIIDDAEANETRVIELRAALEMTMAENSAQKARIGELESDCNEALGIARGALKIAEPPHPLIKMAIADGCPVPDNLGVLSRTFETNKNGCKCLACNPFYAGMIQCPICGRKCAHSYNHADACEGANNV